jgi:hypothetical protein
MGGEAVSRGFGENFPKVVDEIDWVVILEGNWVGFFGDEGEEGSIKMVETTIVHIKDSVKRSKHVPLNHRLAGPIEATSKPVGARGFVQG